VLFHSIYFAPSSLGAGGPFVLSHPADLAFVEGKSLNKTEKTYRNWALTERWRPLRCGELVLANIDAMRENGSWVLSKVETNEFGEGWTAPPALKQSIANSGVLKGLYGLSEVKLRKFGLDGVGDVKLTIPGPGGLTTEGLSSVIPKVNLKRNEMVKITDVEDPTADPRFLPRSYVLTLPTSHHFAAPAGSISASKQLTKELRVFAMYPETTAFYGANIHDNEKWALRVGQKISKSGPELEREELSDDAVLLTFDGDTEYTQDMALPRGGGEVAKVEKVTNDGQPIRVVPAYFITLIPKGDENY